MTTAPAQTPAQRVPTWVAPVVLLAIVVAVGWFIWWYLVGSMPRRHIVEVDPARVQQESMRAIGREVTNRARQPEPRGIKRINDGEWIVNSTAGSIQVRKLKNDYRLRATYHLAALLSPEERRVIMAHRRFTTDDAMARQVGLTPAQVKQLRAIQPVNLMPLTDADQQTLKTLWLIYVDPSGAAPKQEAQDKLLATFDDLAKTLHEPAAVAAQARVVEMKSAITPEMLAKLK
jgi:hypothetical protein